MGSDPLRLALAALRRRDYSRRGLFGHLLEHGVEEAEAQAVVERLARDGFLNERRAAEDLVEQARRKHLSRRRAEQTLREREYPEETVAAALASWDEAEELSHALAAIRGVSGANAARRAFGKLLRAGFDEDAARRALDRLNAGGTGEEAP